MPIFAINYEILDANTNLPVAAPISSFLTNVDNILRSFDVSSGNPLDNGVYQLKINAWFAGFPMTKYSSPFTLKITTMCGNN